MKLTVQTFLTLDGVMQAPGGPEEDPSDDFAHGGWQAPFDDPAVGDFVTDLNGHASTLLLGRRTFDIFRGYWPDQVDPDNPIATTINSLPKYVVSRTLDQGDATWRGEHADTAHLVHGEVVAQVRALKDEPGDGLQVWKWRTAPDPVAARPRRPLPPDDLSGGPRFGPALVQHRCTPDHHGADRHRRVRPGNGARHLRAVRPGSPRADVAVSWRSRWPSGGVVDDLKAR